jgi:hypothetical protein
LARKESTGGDFVKAGPPPASVKYKEKNMRKPITNFLALVVSLLCLFILGACPPDAGSGGDDAQDGEIGQVTITNIPQTVGTNGPASFKIYIQLSTSTKEKDPHAAVSSGRINGNSSVTLNLYKEQNMQELCTVSEKYYVAVTISPENAPSVNAIEARILGISPVSTSKIKSIDWGSLTPIPIPDKVKAIYELVIKVDDEINTSEKSHPNRPPCWGLACPGRSPAADGGRAVTLSLVVSRGLSLFIVSVTRYSAKTVLRSMTQPGRTVTGTVAVSS